MLEALAITLLTPSNAQPLSCQFIDALGTSIMCMFEGQVCLSWRNRKSSLPGGMGMCRETSGWG